MHDAHACMHMHPTPHTASFEPLVDSFTTFSARTRANGNHSCAPLVAEIGRADGLSTFTPAELAHQCEAFWLAAAPFLDTDGRSASLPDWAQYVLCTCCPPPDIPLQLHLPTFPLPSYFLQVRALDLPAPCV